VIDQALPLSSVAAVSLFVFSLGGTVERGGTIYPLALSALNISKASAGLRFLWTTARTALIIDHRIGNVRLEDIAAHVDASGALLDGIVGHRERITLRKLFAPGHDYWHRAGRSDGFKAFVHVVGLDVLRAELRDNAAGQPEIFCIAQTNSRSISLDGRLAAG